MVFFLVKSAYKVAVELEANREIGSCSNGSNLRQFWKRLWSLQIPHKIRHFAWRAARDILPTKSNLVCRNVLGDSTCEECGEASESLFHLFWECTKAKETWISTGMCPVFHRKFLHNKHLTTWKQSGLHLNTFFIRLMLIVQSSHLKKLLVLVW